ncbi:hypothetical protein TNCV_1988311 [Trichonephila clavipes]|nr:hypothetical protein TNCV_1988311 [Trichonephila clavipes]
MRGHCRGSFKGKHLPTRGCLAEYDEGYKYGGKITKVITTAFTNRTRIGYHKPPDSGTSKYHRFEATSMHHRQDGRTPLLGLGWKTVAINSGPKELKGHVKEKTREPVTMCC